MESIASSAMVQERPKREKSAENAEALENLVRNSSMMS